MKIHKGLVFLVLVFITSCGAEPSETPPSTTESQKSINITQTSQELSEKSTVDPAMISEANVMVSAQDFTGALAILEPMYKKYPDNVDVLMNYTQALAQKGSITYQENNFADQALAVLTPEILGKFNNSELYRIVGYSYEIKQDYENAINAYEQSLTLDEQNYVTLSQLGHTHRLMGNFPKAKKYFLQALKINPDYYHALVNIAYIYRGENNLKKSQETLEIALPLTQDTRAKSEIYLFMGNIAMQNQDFNKALDFYKSAQMSDPNYDLARLQLGRIYFIYGLQNRKNTHQLQQYLGLAYDELMMAMDLNPNKSAVYETLGDIYLARNDKKTAKVLFQKAQEVLGNDITLGKVEKEVTKKRLQEKKNKL